MIPTCEYRLVFLFSVYDEDGRHEEKDKRRMATYTFDLRDREPVEKIEEHIFEYLADKIRRMYNDNKGTGRN